MFIECCEAAKCYLSAIFFYQSGLDSVPTYTRFRICVNLCLALAMLVVSDPVPEAEAPASPCCGAGGYLSRCSAREFIRRLGGSAGGQQLMVL